MSPSDDLHLNFNMAVIDIDFTKIFYCDLIDYFRFQYLNVFMLPKIIDFLIFLLPAHVES